MSCYTNQMLFKHELADMVFCTAKLTLERIQEELELELELEEAEQREGEPVEVETLGKIIHRFINENKL